MHGQSLRKAIGACLLAGSCFGTSIAAADTIDDVNFTYSDPNAGNLTATGSLIVDVTTGQALSGSGTINSSLYVNAGSPPTAIGNRPFFLVTLGNCPTTTSNCGMPGGLGSGGEPFTWRDSDGTDLPGDTSFSLTNPYVSTGNGGLLFAVGSPGQHTYNVNNHNYDSFLIGANGPGAWGEFLSEGGDPQSTGDSKDSQVFENVGSGGTMAITGVTPVPLPAAALLMLGGLGGLGAFARGKRAA